MSTAVYPEEHATARLNHWRGLVYPIRNRKTGKKCMAAVVKFLAEERGKSYQYAQIVSQFAGKFSSFTVEKALYELTLIKAICHRRKHGGYWIPVFKFGETVPHDELPFWEGCTTEEVTFTEFFHSEEDEE